MKERIYTKEEVAALLERTADLQRQVDSASGDRQGLTLSELASIASEAGLEPELLRQAATELDQPHRSLFETSSGATSTHVFAERWVPGRFTNEVWEDIVAELRHRFDSTMGMSMGMPHLGMSTTETIGRTAEWRHASPWGVETRIMMRQMGDRVRVRLSRKVGWASPVIEALITALIPVGLVALITGAATESALWTILASLLTLAVFVPGFTWIDQSWRRKKDRELEEIGDHIAHMVANQSGNVERAIFGERSAEDPGGVLTQSTLDADASNVKSGAAAENEPARIPLDDEDWQGSVDDTPMRSRGRTNS